MQAYIDRPLEDGRVRFCFTVVDEQDRQALMLMCRTTLADERHPRDLHRRVRNLLDWLEKAGELNKLP